MQLHNGSYIQKHQQISYNLYFLHCVGNVAVMRGQYVEFSFNICWWLTKHPTLPNSTAIFHFNLIHPVEGYRGSFHLLTCLLVISSMSTFINTSRSLTTISRSVSSRTLGRYRSLWYINGRITNMVLYIYTKWHYQNADDLTNVNLSIFNHRSQTSS